MSGHVYYISRNENSSYGFSFSLFSDMPDFTSLFTSGQKFGMNIFNCFWKKSLMLSKVIKTQ